ncbi:MAG: phosphatase PAP2 family protein [Candidatus Diapherotrites archaeon]|nr:phosphatase PAP2 family protein [Candidatus Diapherotrites archaeon]
MSLEFLFAGITPAEIVFSQAVQQLVNPITLAFFLAINALGSPVTWVLLAALLYWSNKENESFMLINTILISSLIVGGLKKLIARPRPSAEFLQILAKDDVQTLSFPSGHSAIMASILSYYSKIEKKLFLPLLIVALIVAFARIFLGMHYLTDVVAGLLIGYFAGILGFKAREKFIKSNYQFSKFSDKTLMVVTVILFLVVTFFNVQVELTASILGYYFGFFLFREIEFSQTKTLGKRMIAKQIIGFIGLGILMFATTLFKDTIPIFSLIFFFAGFWVSFLYPWLFEQQFKFSKPKKIIVKKTKWPANS